MDKMGWVNLKNRNVFKTVLPALGLIPLFMLFQNCTAGFKPAEVSNEFLASEVPQIPKTCTLPDGSTILPDAFVSGYPQTSAVSPSTCGTQVRRTCQESGEFDGDLPVYESCAQFCQHPDNAQPVDVGFEYVYYTKSNGTSQADCNSARVVTRCDQASGLFSPQIPQQSYPSCLVQGQTCAYTSSTGTATPTGNMVNSTVTGYASASSTYPALCGSQVTRTCQASGWGGSVPLYTNCAQRCLHPDSSSPVNAGTEYVYYTISKGTAQQCAAARVTSTCNQSSGLFQNPVPAQTRYAVCQIQVVPDRVTYEMLMGTDTQYNVFKQHCASCHNASAASGGLNLSDVNQAKSKASTILSRMKHENPNLPTMPTTGTLQDPYLIALVEKWVSLGAPSDTVIGGTVENPFQCSSQGSTSMKPMRRLTRDEISNVLASLGSSALTSEIQSKVDTIPQDMIVSKILDYQIFLTEDQVQLYQGLASGVMDLVLSNDTVYSQLAGTCFQQSSLTTACRDAYIDKVSLKTYRRPLTAAEKSDLVARTFTTGVTARESAALVMYRLVLSPQFLFHLDMGTSADPVNGSLPLSPYEVASRLSFALWDGPPDDTLYNAAKNNQLATLDQVRAQFDRMVLDARAKTKLMRFFRYWLAPKQYSADSFATNFLAEVSSFNATMTEMNREMEKFIEYIVWTKKGSFKDLLLDKTSFASTSQAATIYGHAAVSGANMAQMGGERAGLLLRTPFLMTEGNETHPIIRGVKLRSRILCEELGAPSGVLVAGNSLFGDAAKAMYSVRHRTTELTKTESCMACHAKINPLGFALEAYDNLGRFRTAEKAFSTVGQLLATHPIDTNVSEPLIDSSTSNLSGGLDMVQKIVDGDRAPACFVKQAHRFYSFQNETAEDNCQLGAVFDKLKTPGYVNAPILDVYREMTVNANIFKRRVR